MRHFVLLLVLLFPVLIVAEEFNPLPFEVKIDGKTPKAQSGANVATLADPVSSKASLNFGPGMTIANIVSSDSKGTPTSGAPTIVIVAQNGSATLSDTLNKEELSPGTYLLNAVAAGKTARIVFTVK